MTVQSVRNQRVTSGPAVPAARSSSNIRSSGVFTIDTQTTQNAAAARSSSPTPTPQPAASGQGNSAAADFRQLFGGLAAVPPSADTAPATPPFVPTFQYPVGTDGTQQWNLNHDYFATKETAQWIANKYGNGQVIEVPFEGSGGPFRASATEYQIKLSDGRMVNAGILAGYYERNPESQFPGLADKLIRSQLG
jgi:hypothetical protein